MRALIGMIIVLIAIVLLSIAFITFIAGPGWAQNIPYFSCEQYNNPQQAGDFCISNGAGSFFYPFSGDVTNLNNSPQCNQFNKTGCGKLTVKGLNGYSFNGTLSDGQGWCFQLSTNSMIPCSFAANVSNYTGAVQITANSGNGTDKLNCVNVNGIINTCTYGADPTHSTCSSAAFNKAFAAACAMGSSTFTPPVSIPAGWYDVSCSPVVNNCANYQPFEIFGAGPTATVLDAGDGTLFPVLSNIADTYGNGFDSNDNFFTGPALVGSGNSAYWKGLVYSWYDLREVMALPFSGGALAPLLNGLSAATLFNDYVDLVPPAGEDGGYHGLIYVGTGLTDDYSVFYVSSNSGTATLYVTLRTSVTGHISLGPYNITQSANHHVRVVLSGGKLFVFIDGVDQTGGGATATGTIVQPITDAFDLGVIFSGGGDSHMSGYINSIDIENNDVGCSSAGTCPNFTPPVAKPTKTAHTLLLSTTWTQLVAAGTGQSQLMMSWDYPSGWLPKTGYVGPLGMMGTIHDLSINGGSIGLLDVTNQEYNEYNLNFPYQNFASLAHTAYSYFGQCSVGIHVGNAHYYGIYDTNSSEPCYTSPFVNGGFAQIWNDSGGGTFISPTLVPESQTDYGFLIAGGGGAAGATVITQPVIDNENSSTFIPLFFDGGAMSATVSGGALGGSGGSYPTVQITSLGAPSAFQFNNVAFGVSPIFNFTSSTGATVTMNGGSIPAGSTITNQASTTVLKNVIDSAGNHYGWSLPPSPAPGNVCADSNQNEYTVVGTCPTPTATPTRTATPTATPT